MGAVVLLLNAGGWGAFLLANANRATAGLSLGIAVTAFVLGMRHAFDGDHIAAIDNTTRKLIDEGRDGSSTGFWFALGHSSVVLGAVLLLLAGFQAFAAQLSDGNSPLRSAASSWGGVVSGLFLLLVGFVNLGSLVGICRSIGPSKAGTADEVLLASLLQRRGLLNRMLWPIARRINHPRMMFPVGLLFGLGLDTAATIGLFVITGRTLFADRPFFALVLPVLFAAGMTLFDSLDGVLMSRAYRWAFARPVGKVYYNVVVTSISVVVAFLVAMVCLSGTLVDGLNLDSGPVVWIASIGLQDVGFIIVGTFLVAWLAAIAVWKIRGRNAFPSPVARQNRRENPHASDPVG